MTARAITTCDVCKQSDDHPKMHYGSSTFHHDCVPEKLRNTILVSAHSETHRKQLQRIFSGSDAGLKGPHLLAHIKKGG